jgi:tetratricopeptide (TPR) repeat protein
MKRGVWLAIAALVVVAVGVTLVALPRGPEWTTSSPEALKEYQAAMEAEQKLYTSEVGEHLTRAYEADPDFLVAKLGYANHLGMTDKERADELRQEVFDADLSKVTPRERFFIEYAKAYREKRPEDAAALLDDYFARYPDDPYILYRKATWTWSRGDLEEAERLYQRLIEIRPNWVISYNQLGYIAMMQGRFAEAEEYFKSYRFIAPDQANPHDSLGELFITLGRYDEAEESLEKAIEIKPDFWHSYDHLALAKACSGDLAGMREEVARARAAGMPEEWLARMECFANYEEMASREAWQEILDNSDSDCVKDFKDGYPFVITHLAASRLGDWDTAQKIEEEISEVVAKVRKSGDDKNTMVLEGALNHMKGVRLALQGDLAGAEERLRAADMGLTYMAAGTAWYKLYNRMFLAEILLAEGEDAEAHQLLSQVRSVNPMIVAEFEDSGFNYLGLKRS